MASIKKRENGKWRARYRDDSGREHARHSHARSTPRVARRGDGQRRPRRLRKPRDGKVTVRTYAKSWEAVQVSSKGTASVVDKALRLHVLPVLGDRRIGSVRRSDVQALVKALEGKGLSAGTVRNIYDVASPRVRRGC